MDIIDKYEPYGLKLYDHQRETIRFILQHQRCFVFDEIGTGKTLSSLSACDILMYHGKIEKVLIVSPLSVMRATWTDHLVRYFPNRYFTVLHGNKSLRIANLELNVEFYIINTDGIKLINNQLVNKKFDVVIVDESTTFASHKSQRTKAMWRITNSVKSVICLTGSPIANDTIQSYAQAKLVHYNEPKYFTRFRDQLKTKLNMYTYIDKPEAIELAYSVLKPSIRHKMDDCLDLPPMSYMNIDIATTKEQDRHYKLMEKEYLTFLDSGEVVTAANAAVKYIKLLQISCGIIIDEDGNAINLDNKHRLKELKLILSQVESLIVFANFTKSINTLIEEIPSSEKIDGSVNSNKRYDIIQRFQDKKLKTLICQPQAISHGVTLTAAHTIVYWSPVFSNEVYQQTQGRIRRPGQKHKQLIINFQSTKAEKRVYSALKRKQKISEAMLNYKD